MDWSELAKISIHWVVVLSYIPLVIYAYGRCNKALNHEVPILEVAKWNYRRNLALILAITLPWAVILYYYLEHPGVDGCAFTLKLKKQDDLFRQEINELPDRCLWSGNHRLGRDIKRRWEEDE